MGGDPDHLRIVAGDRAARRRRRWHRPGPARPRHRSRRHRLPRRTRRPGAAARHPHRGMETCSRTARARTSSAPRATAAFCRSRPAASTCRERRPSRRSPSCSTSSDGVAVRAVRRHRRGPRRPARRVRHRTALPQDVHRARQGARRHRQGDPRRLGQQGAGVVPGRRPDLDAAPPGGARTHARPTSCSSSSAAAPNRSRSTPTARRSTPRSRHNRLADDAEKRPRRARSGTEWWQSPGPTSTAKTLSTRLVRPGVGREGGRAGTAASVAARQADRRPGDARSWSGCRSRTTRRSVATPRAGAPADPAAKSRCRRRSVGHRRRAAARVFADGLPQRRGARPADWIVAPTAASRVDDAAQARRARPSSRWCSTTVTRRSSTASSIAHGDCGCTCRTSSGGARTCRGSRSRRCRGSPTRASGIGPVDVAVVRTAGGVGAARRATPRPPSGRSSSDSLQASVPVPEMGRRSGGRHPALVRVGGCPRRDRARAAG